MEPSNGYGARSPWATSEPQLSRNIARESVDDNGDDLDPEYGSHHYHPPRTTTNDRDYGGEPGPSRHEIVSQASEQDSPVYTPGDLEDRVHLTSSATVWKRSAPYEHDLERRRKQNLITTHTHDPHRVHNLSPIDIDSENRDPDLHTPSPRSKRGGLGLRAMSKSIKRASIRVVNFAGADLDDRPVRLEDVDDHDSRQQPHGGGGLWEGPAALRGQTLGIFGPSNPVRLAMHRLLTSACVLLLL